MKATFGTVDTRLKADFDASDSKLKATLGLINEVEVEKEVPIIIEGDYEALFNKPKINTVTLIGDKSFEDLGLESITNTELNEMFK